MLETAALSNSSLIVHSHLSWDWVWQRPQQFISRLSRQHRVLFVDALRVMDIVEPSVEVVDVPAYPNITLLRMTFPSSRWNAQHADWVDEQRFCLLQDVLYGALRGRFNNPVQWFYDPMAVTAFAGRLNERAIVYDCMDELSGFKFAPPELARRERELLQRADLVFTGGKRLWDAKRHLNANCHFYGCGVDVEHFGAARLATTIVPSDLPQGPVLGYFGVVDERLDYDLLAKLADSELRCNIVVIGPMAKVEVGDLPQRANLHFLGRRDYSQLSCYAKGFDICLMPFARNAATEYINPTKALEYMATARPIVSSDVPDVVANFSGVVKIATNHDEFIAACGAALKSPSPGAIAEGLCLAKANTWEAIVTELERRLTETLLRKHSLPAIAINQRTVCA